MAKILKIVSGGQTGADQGALEACLHCRFDYGGWIPKGRKSENGNVPVNFDKLKETDSADYLKRTEANVIDSDATLIFTDGLLAGESKRTSEFCEKHGKPWLHVDLKEAESYHPESISSYHQPKLIEKIVKWLDERCPEKTTLNVTGSRESKDPGIQARVKILVGDLLMAMNRELFDFWLRHGIFVGKAN